MQPSPVVQHARAELRQRLEAFMATSRREQELIEQIMVAARELAELRRRQTDQARATAVDAAALLAHVERTETVHSLLTG
jgi:hypothetical protein